MVLSEALAFEACADLANEVLEKEELDVRYTGSELLASFVGRNFGGMLDGLQERHHFTMTGEEREAKVSQELKRVTAKLEAEAEPCVNCTPELQKLYDSKKYGMAVVSSSALTRVEASLQKVDQYKYFPPNHIFSAATSLDKPTSKPNPAIYLHACKVIGVHPSECLAVEDSMSGAGSANNAGIPTIGYLGSYETREKKDEIRGKMSRELGVKVFMDDWKQFPKCLAKIEAM